MSNDVVVFLHLESLNSLGEPEVWILYRELGSALTHDVDWSWLWTVDGLFQGIAHLV